MKLLKKTIHPAITTLDNKSIITRNATRSIVIRDSKILLLYTARYEDYSLPGGGIDEGESIEHGFIRELSEETGAQNIRNLSPFGIYEEYRPSINKDYDVMHILSYCYSCDIDEELGPTKYESYETKNGMKPVWIDINEAIAHNEQTLKNSPKSGLSIEREIFLLKEIRAEFGLKTQVTHA